MDFEKRLKLQLCFSIGYFVIGVIIIVLGLTKLIDFVFSISGFFMLALGVILFVMYKKKTKDEETLRRHRVAANDERNVYISTRAKSIAFDVYILVAATVLIFFAFTERAEILQTITLSLDALLIIYSIVYFVINKKS